jgi:hypothetical protein
MTAPTIDRLRKIAALASKEAALAYQFNPNSYSYAAMSMTIELNHRLDQERTERDVMQALMDWADEARAAKETRSEDTGHLLRCR